MTSRSTAELVRELLRRSGVPQSELLDATPVRVADSYRDLLAGYAERPGDSLRTFDAAGFAGELEIGPIPFTSLCQHHILPFSGSVTVRYRPGNRVLGLSKFSRVVSVFSRRLQTQERLTRQIADALEDVLRPGELEVRVTAEHFCMRMRGVRDAGVMTTTTETRGRYD
ncbi:MAG: GTP cyclohydrolase I [Patescibacteria group bacterium]